MAVMTNTGTNVVERLDETVAALRARASLTPAVGVVLGSGLGAFGDSIGDVVRIPYAEVPNIPPPRVVGHAGNFLFGHVGSVPVVCMQGRIHGYEGHPTWQVVHGVRAMARLGAKAVLLTNAAGGLEPSWSAGDLMIVSDHLNLMHTSPLIGPNEEALGTRFPDMTNAYDAELRKKLSAVGVAEKIALREGVYAGLPGPSYETPAEIRMLRILGAQAVGMSTVPEVIALRHMRVPVAALSCITNLAAGVAPGELDHAEVEATAKARRGDLERLLRGWILATAGARDSG
jgi:purine-nucleoside phosphorylase